VAATEVVDVGKPPSVPWVGADVTVHVSVRPPVASVALSRLLMLFVELIQTLVD